MPYNQHQTNTGSALYITSSIGKIKGSTFIGLHATQLEVPIQLEKELGSNEQVLSEVHLKDSEEITRQIAKLLLEEVRLEVCNFTMYKLKAKKIHPIDNVPLNRLVFNKNPNQREKRWAEVMAKAIPKHYLDAFITPKFSNTALRSRLTSDCWEAIKKKCKGTLQPAKLALLKHVMLNQEAVLAWEFNYYSKVYPSITPLQKIRTILYKAQQSLSILISRLLIGKVIDLLKSCIQRGIIEESHRLYCNTQFLVEKKDGRLRLINNATKYNQYTPQDAFIPLGVDEFLEEFAGYVMMSLLDLFLGYN